MYHHHPAARQLTFITSLINVHTFAELATLKYLSISVNALAAAGDVLIAGTLSLLLHRSRTGFQKRDTMINQLVCPFSPIFSRGTHSQADRFHRQHRPSHKYLCRCILNLRQSHSLFIFI